MWDVQVDTPHLYKHLLPKPCSQLHIVLHKLKVIKQHSSKLNSIKQYYLLTKERSILKSHNTSLFKIILLNKLNNKHYFKIKSINKSSIIIIFNFILLNKALFIFIYKVIVIDSKEALKQSMGFRISFPFTCLRLQPYSKYIKIY